MPKNNYPNVAANDLPTEFVSDSIDSLQALAAMGKITGDTSQDAEFEERIAKIINFCQRSWTSSRGRNRLCWFGNYQDNAVGLGKEHIWKYIRT